MFKNFLILSLSLPFLIAATDLKPWYETDLEVVSRTKLMYQSFQKVETSRGETSYPSNDMFLTQSFGSSFDVYAGEVEMTAAATRKQHFNLDNLKLTGRYRLMNDVAYDPVSLVAGLSLIQVGKPALFDPASFHHGRFEVEAHLAIGKEVSQNQFWLKRYFGVFAFGLSSGSPWVRADFTYEQNFCDLHQLKVFANTLFGLGSRDLRLSDFHGYRSIRHQSIDLGIGYSYFLEKIGGMLVGEYSYRVYAKNFPKNASRLSVSLQIPFGLGI